MWVMTNVGFISLVQKRGDSMLCVRARVRDHLTALFGEHVEVKSDSGTDYQFRAYVTREAAALVIANAVESINYPNFKSSVKDRELHDAYMGVWTVMNDYGMAVERKNRPRSAYNPRPLTRRSSR